MADRIGISAFAWTADFTAKHLELLPWLEEQGFAALEAPMFDPSALPVAAIRRAFAETELDCTVCAILPAGINPISPDAATRTRSIAHLMECVEATAAMGSRLLGGPLFAPIGYLPEHRPTEDEWRWAVEAFQVVSGHLEKHNVTLSIEPVNRSETFFLRTAAEAKRLCEAVGHPRVGVTIDTFHANIEERSIPAAIALLGSHLKHMHISENDRGLLGQGHVDFPAIVRALESVGYDGYLMIEGFGYSPTEPKAPGALWAELDVSAERLAVEGMGYLRALRKASVAV
ncbi:D-tagatose 3-epimerase [Granulicella rosea]|uniref:D-tagatose 3-epimerase n=1 Tax=Granulicella rosea TaxID=474952 RepID=A0A239DTF3_9BACT|nr:sugar phosphate isomerase/epimerase family protein [Granulicella rosea]SNS35925.1 D-tagatose 3-epimerase [Granulicella rosea]